MCKTNEFLKAKRNLNIGSTVVIGELVAVHLSDGASAPEKLKDVALKRLIS
jgi:hypothetical protein